jgi:hypothetical protein
LLMAGCPVMELRAGSFSRSQSPSPDVATPRRRWEGVVSDQTAVCRAAPGGRREAPVRKGAPLVISSLHCPGDILIKLVRAQPHMMLAHCPGGCAPSACLPNDSNLVGMCSRKGCWGDGRFWHTVRTAEALLASDPRGPCHMAGGNVCVCVSMRPYKCPI